MQGQTADEPHDEFPVRNAKLSATDVGKATLKKSPLASPEPPTETKRVYRSPLNSGAKRLTKDSALTDTPSTVASTSPTFRPTATRTVAQDRNLVFGLDDPFMFKIYNAFRDQSRGVVIRGSISRAD